MGGNQKVGEKSVDNVYKMWRISVLCGENQGEKSK
jgi:hypothetical protein